MYGDRGPLAWDKGDPGPDQKRALDLFESHTEFGKDREIGALIRVKYFVLQARLRIMRFELNFTYNWVEVSDVLLPSTP